MRSRHVFLAPLLVIIIMIFIIGIYFNSNLLSSNNVVGTAASEMDVKLSAEREKKEQSIEKIDKADVAEKKAVAIQKLKPQSIFSPAPILSKPLESNLNKKEIQAVQNIMKVDVANATEGKAVSVQAVTSTPRPQMPDDVLAAKFPKNLERSLTMPEMRSMKINFDSFDADKDNVITQNDTRKFLKRMQIVVSDEQLKDAFKSMDINHNGIIEMEEYFLVRAKIRAEGPNRVLRKFKQYDANNDGQLNKEEIQLVVKGGAGVMVSSDVIEKAIKFLDTNKDEQLNLNEAAMLIRMTDYSLD